MNGWAQDFKKDYVEFTQKINSSPFLVFSASVGVYDKKDINIKTFSIVYQKNEKAMYYKTDVMELYTDYSKSVMVKQDAKTVVWSDVVDKSDKKETDWLTIQDSIVKKIDSIRFLGELDGVKKYQLFIKKSVIRSIEMHFSVSTGLLHYLKYAYNRSEELRVAYSEVLIKQISIERNSSIVTKQLEDYIIQDKVSKKVQLSPAYSGYRLIYFNDKNLIQYEN
jgi:hypothetical protein